MSQTFVIPDLHGRLDLLDSGLAEIAARSKGDEASVILLGDYVDKGPMSKGVIERLMRGAGEGVATVTLKGNHDAMMVEALRDHSKMADWLGKGGEAALASYGGSAADVPQSHIEWLDALPLFHADTHRLYVHAGVDPDVALERQNERTLLWKRYPRGYPEGFGHRHVVHGHDNDPDGPLLYEGRTNLDTQAWRTGRLMIGIFDDERPGGPIDFIVLKGSPIGR